jgi:hypothetical protein
MDFSKLVKDLDLSLAMEIHARGYASDNTLYVMTEDMHGGHLEMLQKMKRDVESVGEGRIMLFDTPIRTPDKDAVVSAIRQYIPKETIGEYFESLEGVNMAAGPCGIIFNAEGVFANPYDRTRFVALLIDAVVSVSKGKYRLIIEDRSGAEPEVIEGVVATPINEEDCLKMTRILAKRDMDALEMVEAIHKIRN